MGCKYGCRPYRDYDFDRRKDRDFFIGSPYGPLRRRHRYYRDDDRSHPHGGDFFGFPRIF